MNQLVALFQAGRFPEMEGTAKALIERDSKSGLAWKAYGAALLAQGKDALHALQHAVALLPDDADSFGNLGNALRDRGNLHEAVASYRRALTLKSDHAIACWGLSNTLLVLGKAADAAASYRHLLSINPNHVEAHNNLGSVLRTLGQFESALTCFRRAIELRPDYAEAYNNLGIVLLDLGKLDEGLASYRRALEIKPDYADVYSNLGDIQRHIGNGHEAVASYRRALEINPGYAEAYNNLGNALWDLGEVDAAVKSYRRALEIKPDYVQAFNNLGNTLRNIGEPGESVTYYRQALAIKPDFVEVYDNLLMALQFVPGTSAEDLFAAHLRFGHQFETPLKPRWSEHSNSRDPAKRLKIGYVSGDMRRHPVAYFIEPVLDNRDKSQVEVFCYSNSVQCDAMTERLMVATDHWIPCIGMSDEQLAQRIRADGIDILVDLAGHTAHNRLLAFARKPAPVQITYLGYPGTSGLSAMDYRLTDNYTEPEGGSAERYYTEKLLRLPDSLWCYRPAENMPEVTPLPALANGYLTFGSFNNVNKVGSECIALWAMLLRSLPTARLLMATVAEGEMRERLIQQFQEHNIAAERISFCGKLPSEQFQRKLQEVDITLDPFPVNGATTTCESLWLGVPVLTLVGERFLSRAGLSVLSAADLPEFAAATQEDYIRTATALANDLPRLAALRAGLRDKLRSTPLFDQQRFTRNLEGVYRDVWHRYVST